MKPTRLALLAAASAGVAFAQSAATAPAPSAPAAPAATPPAVTAKPAAPASFGEALTHGKISANARLRYETVDQDGFADADALTLRIRAGYTTALYKGFQAMVEGEASTPLVKDYYDGTGTNTTPPTAAVADPEIYEINQAWLAYTYEKTKLIAGRQRIVLDNARFIGDVAWRQNQQTFDAAVVQDKSLKNTTLTYAYLEKVNRVFDDSTPQYDWHSDSHVLNASYSGLKFGTFTGYAYLLDFTETEELAKNNSTQTYGLSFAGSAPVTEDIAALYRLEYATQSDYASSSLAYQSDYYIGELGAKVFKNYSLSVGHEVLGSDDGKAGSGFKTPLATLHAFNGWADKFLVTPSAGLKDTYVKTTAELPLNLSFLGFYHWFQTEDTGDDIGTELDLQLVYKLNKQLSFTAKTAFYDGETGGAAPGKTNKFWLQADYAY